MLKSNFDYTCLNEASNEKLENILSLSIYNKGTKAIHICGQTLEANTQEAWVIEPTGFLFDFELKHIKFSGEGIAENNALVYFLQHSQDNYN